LRSREWGAFDYVFHFASPASPVDYAAHGIETLRVDRMGRLKRWRRRAVWREIHDGIDLGVLRDPLVHPQTESYWGNVNPIGRGRV